MHILGISKRIKRVKSLTWASVAVHAPSLISVTVVPHSVYVVVVWSPQYPQHLTEPGLELYSVPPSLKAVQDILGGKHMNNR